MVIVSDRTLRVKQTLDIERIPLGNVIFNYRNLRFPLPDIRTFYEIDMTTTTMIKSEVNPFGFEVHGPPNGRPTLNPANDV